MVSEKLLPCPFCEGEASLTIPSEHVQADCADIYVSCDECEAEGQRFVVEMKDRTPDLWPYEQRDAIAAWNTRAPADLRSALEAETACERLQKAWDSQDDLPPIMFTDEEAAALYAALAPTKESAAGTVLMPAQATREMIDAADACTDAYEAYGKMVEVGRVR